MNTKRDFVYERVRKMMKTISFFSEHPYTRFQSFSSSHVFMLLCCMGALLFLMNSSYFERVQPDSSRDKQIRTIFLGSSVGLELLFYFWKYKTNTFTLADDLPLELCNLSLYLSWIFIITNQSFLFRLLLFFSFGPFLALLFPRLTFGFPHVRFFHFFLQHQIILFILVYMYRVHIKRSATQVLFYRDIWVVLVFLNIHMIVCLIVNNWVGSNYFFVSHKPSNPTPLDYFGPFPMYIIVADFLILLYFHVVYILFKKIVVYEKGSFLKDYC